METPTTRTDRLAQARAEAERRYPHHGEDIGDAYGYGHFMDGWLAADANPQPTTITEKRLREFTIFVLDQADDARGVRWAVVHLLGIEVDDHE